MSIPEFIERVIDEIGTRNVLKIVGSTAIGAAVGFGVGVSTINSKGE